MTRPVGSTTGSRSEREAPIAVHVREAEIGARPYFELVADLQAKARTEGLWCPFVRVDWGGMGLGHLANGLV